MSQPSGSVSPHTARLFNLEYPHSLGVYSTYSEVQSVVDTLADRQFPVQSTLIVGTDLRLMERVTGRRTWGRVIGQGVLSGVWMGLFVGLILMFLSPGNIGVVISAVLMGIVFFTVWSVIGYAMSGGKRDFTSMTATIPMQYELLVEHKHSGEARRILAEQGVAAPQRGTVGVPAAPGAGAAGSIGGAPASARGVAGPYGADPQTGHQHATPPQASYPVTSDTPFGQGGPAAPIHPSAPQRTAPSYGQPAPTAAPSAPAAPAPSRPQFGQPAGTPLRESTAPADRPTDGTRRASSTETPDTGTASGEDPDSPR
ncbi:general stress protein [Brachybacterium sp. J153]|uniref:general stress protein n=1 Tax=Brachybacterium sp. J153 TaxID=3116488 RepID=UPI002E77894A|nr:general stress protein [Brachybacterium sp. J153]MEE1618191.1 general stress protein [Brachybacterium sp. J153]